LFSVPIV